MPEQQHGGKEFLPPPVGFKLCHTLRGHEGIITQVSWSLDGRKLASASNDHTVRLWDAETGELCYTFEGHSDSVYSVAWSPDGKTLISADEHNIQLWDAETGKLHWKKEEGYSTKAVVWSPNGQTLASGRFHNKVVFLNAQNGERPQRPQEYINLPSGGRFLIGGEIIQVSDIRVGDITYSSSYNISSPLLRLRHFTDRLERGRVYSVAWSPDGQTLASACANDTISLHDAETMEVCRELKEHNSQILNVAWSPDGYMLASAFLDGTVRLWDAHTGLQTRVLEGHADAVTCISFSFDGRFLASKSFDDTIRLWRCDTWETIAILYEPASGIWLTNAIFHPQSPTLATLGEKDTVIHIWDLDFPTLLNTAPVIPSVRYINAKVVLVGDTGVGKSGLGLVLSNHFFSPTESTHGRHVWTFDKHGSVTEGDRVETHETLLWDLAGQPGYRLIHQLHLNEVAVALVVFDARSETDPFAGVRYWDRALRLAQRIQGTSTPLLKKFLVAARADRGGVGVSPARIESLKRDLGFADYFETSAKEGWGISQLAEAICGAIDWTMLPCVNSTRLFQRIKEFLVTEKESGRLLSTLDDLYRAFLKSENQPTETENLRCQFETCIGRVESRGLIRRLSFGSLILLQPELLDAYASAVVNAAKDEPDGLGSIAEEDARIGRFRISEDERIKDSDQEKLLLIATVEELLFHEIALRESADDGSYLVFPSQLTREWPDAPDPEGKAVIVEFEGAVLNIYATLAVRLSRSGIFVKQEMWKNAAAYRATVGGLCGMFLREVKEGSGEFTLFFDEAASEQTRFQFEEYVYVHLRRRALPESIKRRRIFVCSGCGVTIPDRHAQLRRERGFDWIACGVCDTRISLLGQEERLIETRSSAVPEMDYAADTQRDRDTAAFILEGKIATNDFDVFLCHNSEDKQAVKQIGTQLKELGILPWLDEWELRPGLPWQKTLEEQIKQIKSAAVFVGKNGIGPWQDAELAAFLRQFVKRECPVIPVILQDCDRAPELPVFLEGMMWVNFRQQEPDPIKQLLWGITGERSSAR